MSVDDYCIAIIAAVFGIFLGAILATQGDRWLEIQHGCGFYDPKTAAFTWRQP